MATKKKADMPQMSMSKYKEMKTVAKKFVSQREGSELYSMGLNTFRKLANDSGAVYRIGRMVLVKYYEDDVCGMGSFKRWLLGYGASVMVLEPCDLAEDIYRILQRRLDRYESVSEGPSP